MNKIWVVLCLRDGTNDMYCCVIQAVRDYYTNHDVASVLQKMNREPEDHTNQETEVKINEESIDNGNQEQEPDLTKGREETVRETETQTNAETEPIINEETNANVNKEQEEVNQKNDKRRKHIAKRKQGNEIVVRDVKKHKSAVVVHSRSKDCVEVDNKSKPVEKKKARLLVQRIPPNWFMALIPKIPRQHRAAIRKIGFGAFLDLDIGAHKSAFSAELVTSLDANRVNLVMDNKEEIDIQLKDIHLVYGLPIGGRKIVEPKKEEDEEWVSFLRTWRGFFNMESGSPYLSKVLDRLNELCEKDLCDDFLWHFVVCVVNTCICSTSRPEVAYKFLYSCMDIQKIHELDWCHYTFVNMKIAAEKWKGGNAYFTGPLPFLLITYFDRLQREKIVQPREFPLLSVWNSERIEERMKIENKRGFGKGVVLKRIAYEGLLEEQVEEHIYQKDPHLQAGSSTSSYNIMGFLDKFGDLAKALASNINEMYVMVDKASDLFKEGDTAEELKRLVDNIWSKYTNKPTEPILPEAQEKVKSPSVLSQDKQMFDEPGFIEELDVVMAKAWEDYQERIGMSKKFVKPRPTKKKKKARDESDILGFKLLTQSQTDEEEEQPLPFATTTTHIFVPESESPVILSDIPSSSALKPTEVISLDSAESFENMDLDLDLDLALGVQKSLENAANNVKSQEQTDTENATNKPSSGKDDDPKERASDVVPTEATLGNNDQQMGTETTKTPTGLDIDGKQAGSPKYEEPKQKIDEQEGGNDESRKSQRCIEKLTQYLRSPFMVKHDAAFKRVDVAKRRMADYAFAEGPIE
ncbi:uncharacterized protein [Spinacia oleracea]|uniref:Aminotransferase-like plant mobile domain-containing protein n=1 Tax=Spinacia oleracea TaxID=3562 RepID=A0ABM3QQC5_SPIOL|nr:uncharacterized protein LOC130461452 [Spinacia oleracea]